MKKVKSAISLGVSALVIIVLIFIVGFGFFLNATFDTTSTETFTHQLTQSSSLFPAVTTSSAYCTISAEPTGFYLHVIADNSDTPIKNARLAVTQVSRCDNGNTTLSDSQESFTTNSSGWITVTLPFLASGNFFLIFAVQYSNSTYTFSKTFDVYWQPEQGTFVTLSIPSGSVGIVYRVPINCNGNCIYASTVVSSSH
jgi:hypothetical protein